jgi:hypothetical protein
MPINPNIALGVQQQQPVNMLGQMGQMMALKAASQDIEGNEALRDFYAQGGDTSTAEGRRQLMARTGAMGSKIIGQQSEILARDVKTQADSLKTIKDNVSLVNSPEGMVEFLRGAYGTPGGALLAKLVPLDKAISAIPTNPKAFEDYKRNLGLTSDKLFESADAQLRAKVDREGHGVQMRGQNMTSQTAANLLDFNTRKRSVIPGDNQFLTTGAFGDIQPVTGYGISAPALPPAAANAFVTARPSVNNLVTQPNAAAPSFVQPGSPTRANAAAIEAQQNIPRPPPRVGYMYNEQGQQVRIPQTGVPEGLKLKPGERWNETSQSVEQVPGSALFIEQQKKHGNDLGSLKTVQATTKWGTGRIDKILDPKNKTGFENNFGGFTAYGTKEFSGNTALVKSELDSLKSDLKNRGLQLFRTGGSIGAMTEKEWPIIESMLATITPKMDAKDARDVLTEVRAKFEALENLAAEKYNDQWQNTQYHKTVETSGGGGAAVPQAAIDMLKSNPALKADFDAKYGAGASKRYLGQ